MKEEDMFIAQKTPEFRVIVVGSELLANRFPWVIRNNNDKMSNLKSLLLKSTFMIKSYLRRPYDCGSYSQDHVCHIDQPGHQDEELKIMIQGPLIQHYYEHYNV